MKNASREPFIRKRLFCPGPTPVPKNVDQAGQETYYHRTEEFYSIFRTCRELLAPMMGTRHLPYILTASGTGAMEAAVTNLTDADDEVIVVSGGKFGERWQKICEAYRCRVHLISVDYGASPTVDSLMSAVAGHPRAKALFIQANETSTGVFYPLADLIPAMRKNFTGLIVVDAISALAAHPIEMDKWGIDCLVGASQKGFGVAPGLAFIAVSDVARQRFSQRPRFYFDLRLEEKEQPLGATAFTPATTLIQGLQASLQEIDRLGIATVVAHHEKLAEACRAAMSAIGLEMFPRGNFSNALTAVRIPAGIEGKRVLAICSDQFGIILAGGQGSMKGKIIRLAHLGFVDRFDLLTGIGALEFALHDAGHRFSPGSGVSAAMHRLI